MSSIHPPHARKAICSHECRKFRLVLNQTDFLQFAGRLVLETCGLFARANAAANHGFLTRKIAGRELRLLPFEQTAEKRTHLRYTINNITSLLRMPLIRLA